MRSSLRPTPTALATAVLLLARTAPASAQVEPLDLRADAWSLRGEAEIVEHEGETVLRLRSGSAGRPDVRFSDGTVEFEFLPGDRRTFLGLVFRVPEDGHYEDVYFRLHKSGLPDALQYTPDFRGRGQWQLYHGPAATASATYRAGRWQRARVEVRGHRAAVFLGDEAEPALVVDSLRSGTAEGYIGFWGNFPGATGDDPPVALVRDVVVRHGETSYEFPPLERKAADPGIVAAWGVSEPFVRSGPGIEALPGPEVAGERWRTLRAEPSGLLPLERDLVRPPGEDPGALAGLRLHADRERTVRLELGYSDEAAVFLNGRLLYAGSNTFSPNFPRRQGLITLDQARLYLPLRAGANELVVTVTEIYGGWGVMGRIEDREGLRVEPLTGSAGVVEDRRR